MKKTTILILFILVSSLFGNEHKENHSHKNYKCDGRKYCSQMKSCQEATFFINNCPNTKMDGDHDGIPCENQWCRNKQSR